MLNEQVKGSLPSLPEVRTAGAELQQVENPTVVRKTRRLKYVEL